MAMATAVDSVTDKQESMFIIIIIITLILVPCLQILPNIYALQRQMKK